MEKRDREGKRRALSRDRRSVLEAVYAVEKLPDAGLRDRLSKYLDLSTRQIQVWFQNRRQREKDPPPEDEQPPPPPRRRPAPKDEQQQQQS